MIFLAACCSLYPETMKDKANNYVKTMNINPNKHIMSKNNINYARKAAQISNLGDQVAVSYGDLGHDDAIATVGDKSYPLVGSPIEFYYTDIVFIKKDYKQALIDLYRQRVEEPDKKDKINDAIKLTVQVADKNGVKINLDKIQIAYNTAIEKMIITAATKYFRKTAYASKSKVIATTKPLIAYYQNPTTANFDKIVRKYAAMFEITANNGWIDDKSLSLAFKRTVDEMNGRLGTRMLREKVELRLGK